MTNFQRRDILQTVGVAGGMAIPTGVATGEIQSKSSGSCHTDVGGTVSTFSASADLAAIAIDTDDVETNRAEFEPADFPDDPESVIALEGEVRENGRWMAESVTVPELTDTLRAWGLHDQLVAFVDGLDLEAIVDAIELEDLLERIVGVIEAIDFSEEEALDIADSLARLLDDAAGIPITGDIQESLEQLIVSLLAEPTMRDYYTLLELLLPLASPLQTSDFEAETQDELTFEDLVEALLSILELESLDELHDELRTSVAEMDEDIDELLDEVKAEFAFTDLGGRFDPRDGLEVTAEIHMVRALTDLPGIPFVSPGNVDIVFDMLLTTDESGTLSGEFDLADDGTDAAVSLLDNEFILGLEYLSLATLTDELEVEDLLELAIESGQLDVEAEVYDLIDALPDEIGIEPEEFLEEFDVETFVLNLDIPAIISGMNLEPGIRWFFEADEPTRHLVELSFEWEFDDGEAVLDLIEAFPARAPSYEISGDLPQDLDGDGLFEDIDGDGALSVLDLQLLYTNMEGIPEAERHFYNFSCGNPERVSVFDIQGLYTKLD